MSCLDSTEKAWRGILPEMAEDERTKAGKLDWLLKRKISAMSALALVLLWRNVEGLAEHLGIADLLTPAYDWLAARDWAEPVYWVAGAFTFLSDILASDIFLGFAIASVVYAFLDYRHKVIEWWDDRRNPSDPQKRLRQQINKIGRIWSDPPRSELNIRIQELKKCRDHFHDEPCLLYALDTIIMSLEHHTKMDNEKLHSLPVDIWLFTVYFGRAVRKEKGERDSAVARLLRQEKRTFTLPVFSERIINAPVNLYEDEILQSPEGTEEEMQPRNRHD